MQGQGAQVKRNTFGKSVQAAIGDACMAGRRWLYLISVVPAAAFLAGIAASPDSPWFELARLSPYMFFVALWLVLAFLNIRLGDLGARVLTAAQARAIRWWGPLVAFSASPDDELHEFTKLKATIRPIVVAYGVSTALAAAVFFGAI